MPGLGGPRGRLIEHRGLSPAQIDALEELAATCTSHDGGRLKLEIAALRSRKGDRPSEWTWWEGSDLIAFLGLYHWQPAEAEATGMVRPDRRRQGIFSRLFEHSLAELRRRGSPRTLLVVDRGSDAGRGFVSSIGASYEHSEHRMLQRRPPADLEPDPSLLVRPARPDDVEFVINCLAAAFDTPAQPFSFGDFGVDERVLVVERSGVRVGTLRLDLSRSAAGAPSSAGIYAFGILPEHQGQGIGRRVLTETVTSLRAQGVSEIGLEVAVENDAALSVYERCGFDRMSTDDYFELSEPAAASHPAAG